MKLNYVEFITTNEEVIRIDGKYVGAFGLNNIHHHIGRVSSNSFNSFKVADEFYIEIAKDAESLHKLSQTKFQRLVRGKDIAKITVKLSKTGPKGTRTVLRSCNVFWKGNDPERNDAQIAYISQLGNLYIVISKDKQFKDYFNYAKVNDEAYMDFLFDVYGIGEEDDMCEPY